MTLFKSIKKALCLSFQKRLKDAIAAKCLNSEKYAELASLIFQQPPRKSQFTIFASEARNIFMTSKVTNNRVEWKFKLGTHTGTKIHIFSKYYF